MKSYIQLRGNWIFVQGNYLNSWRARVSHEHLMAVSIGIDARLDYRFLRGRNNQRNAVQVIGTATKSHQAWAQLRTRLKYQEVLRRLSHQAFVERAGPNPRTFCSSRRSDKAERWARYCFQIGFRFERTIIPTHASAILASIHLLPRPRVISTLSVFLAQPSPFFFGSCHDSVHRAGRLAVRSISSISSTRWQSLTRVLPLLKVGYHREFSASTTSRPVPRDLCATPSETDPRAPGIRRNDSFDTVLDCPEDLGSNFEGW